MSTTDKGNELEQHVIQNVLLYDNTARKAPKEDGDVLCEDHIIECKNFNTKSITIDEDHMEKIERRAYALGRMPAYVRKNRTGRVSITMNFEDFVYLMERFHGQDRKD